MSTTTILATTAAVNASAAANSGSAAPAIWMLMMFVLIVPWAVYLYSDECMGVNGGKKARNATIALVLVGLNLIPVACWIAG